MRNLVSDSVDGCFLGATLVLPWSTSATSICIFCGILLLPFSTRLRPVVAESTGAAGGLPVALVALAAVGIGWSSATWPESLGAWDSYSKLLLIPPLLVHFRTTQNGPRLLAAFLISCGVLLLTAWILTLWNIIFTPSALMELAVPVKNPATQLREFLLAAIALLFLAVEAADRQCWRQTAALLAASLAFFGSALYMAAFFHSLETLTTLIILIVVLGWYARRSRSATYTVLFLAIATAAWTAVPQVNQRIAIERQSYFPGQTPNVLWQGGRGEFWQQSVGFIAQAPLLGHGTGSTQSLFRAAKPTDHAQSVTINPHQQTLAVGIQLGVCGMLLLWAMWFGHLRLFQSSHQCGWAGLLVLGQSIAGSMFDSLLFDFTEGWLYVLAIGVIGGTVTRAPTERQRPNRRGRRTVCC